MTTINSRAPRTRSTKKEESPVEETMKSDTTKTKNFRLGWLNAVLFFLVIVAFGVAGYFYYQYKYNSKEAVQEREVKSITDTIGKVLILPDNEVPTIATVTDREKLAGQAFFQKAENGDKVIIYRESGKAFLYRPSMQKVVDVATLNAGGQAAAGTPKTAAPENAVKEPLSIALYNGSTKVGVTDVAEKQITAELPDSKVIAKEKAANSNYTETTVVDVSGKGGDSIGRIAGLLGGTVGSLPEGEIIPQADILVIIGNPETPIAAPADVPEEKKQN
jgi:cytoskeletal protein RodZ